MGINRMKLFKLLLAVAGATVLLGALVSTASATRLSQSSQTTRATFSVVRFAGGFGTTECALTLEGSLHSRTIAKVEGALIGFITRATLGACSRGSATVLTASLPWHVRYTSFSGTLPAITRLNTSVTGAQFQIREPVFGVTCLASGGATNGNYTRNTATGVLTGVEISGVNLPTNCGINGTLSGNSTALTVLGAATAITVTLI
jgi:hypothetical protein